MKNPPKCTKLLYIHYYPILHGFMNTRRGRSKFKNFLILLDSGCISTIAMVRLFVKIHPENMLWCSDTRNLLISLLILRLKCISTLPTLSATNVVTWKCHVGESDKGSYDIILGRYLLTKLGSDLNLSDHII